MLKQTSRSFDVIWRVISQQIQLTLELTYTFLNLKVFLFHPSPDLRKTWRSSSLTKPHSILNKVAEHKEAAVSLCLRNIYLIKTQSNLQGSSCPWAYYTLEWVFSIFSLKEEAIKNFHLLCPLAYLLPATLLFSYTYMPLQLKLVPPNILQNNPKKLQLIWQFIFLHGTFSSGYSSDPGKKMTVLACSWIQWCSHWFSHPQGREGSAFASLHMCSVFNQWKNTKCKPSTFLFSSTVMVRKSEKSRWKAGGTKSYPCSSPLLACIIVHKEDSTSRDTKDYSQPSLWPFASAHTKFSNII